MSHNPITLPALYGKVLYDLRPDKLGWTVFTVSTGRPVALAEDVILVGVDHERADQIVALLHQQELRRRASEASSTALLTPERAQVGRLSQRICLPLPASQVNHITTPC